MTEIEHRNGLDGPPAGKFCAADARHRRGELTQIGTRLCALYDEVVKEPIPGRLTQLLAELAERDP